MTDSQQHSILQCKHTQLVAILANACTKQREVARNFLKENAKSKNLQHFIKQFLIVAGAPVVNMFIEYYDNFKLIIN
jgi:hypothetical protein